MDWSPESSAEFMQALPVLARLLALMFTLPLVASRLVPVRFRIGLALVMTLALAPSVGGMAGPEHLQDASSGPARIALVLVHELLLGATMGLAAQVVLVGARLAGQMIEGLCGMSFGLPDALGEADESGGQVLSRLFWWTTLAVFVSAGGMTEVVGGVLHSFHLWPAGMARFDSGVLEFLVLALTNGFEFGIRAALPGIAALLIASAVLGITQRSCPQLGGMQIGLGFKSIAGLLVTSLLLLSIPWVINGGVQETGAALQQLLSEGDSLSGPPGHE